MINPSATEWQEILMGETLILSLISRFIYNYPDRAWYQSLYEEDVFSEVPFATDQDETKTGLALMQKWGKDGITDESFEKLHVDYTRLFIGVGKVLAPPWESVHFGEDRLIFQERTLEVRTWYRRFGLEVERKYKEPDDHIGLELLFLSHLASLGIQALEKQDQTRFNELLDAQREFIKMHPGTWALTWCGLVDRNAQTDFFKGLAHLTRGALSALSEILDAKLVKDIAE
jgi:putative dimethyl sulfoxide reductase chaperone